MSQFDIVVFGDSALFDLSDLFRASFLEAFNACATGVPAPALSPALHASKLEGLSARAALERLRAKALLPGAAWDDGAVLAGVASRVEAALRGTAGAPAPVSAPRAAAAAAAVRAVAGAGVPRVAVRSEALGGGALAAAAALLGGALGGAALAGGEASASAASFSALFAVLGVAPSRALVVEACAAAADAAREAGAIAVAASDALCVTPAWVAGVVAGGGALPPPPPRLRIVVPMAGLGSRFEKDGFSIQKPFLPTLEGRQLWEEVVENLMPKNEPLRSATEVHLVVREDQVKNFVRLPHVTLHTVAALTEGPACTVLTLRHLINDGVPLMIGNSDQFLEWDADAFYAASFHEAWDGGISTFYHPRPDDLKWSYAALGADGAVARVAEKVFVGPHATTGLYAWKRGADFVAAADAMIAANIRVNNEFYVCPVYQVAMERLGKRYRVLPCAAFWGVGVPADYANWLDNYAPPGPPPPFSAALARRYDAMWCKWGSRVPVPQPDVAADPTLCACMWATGAFHLTPAYHALRAALAPWAAKAQWYDPAPGGGLAPQGAGATAPPTSYAAAAARPRAVLHHTLFQLRTFPVAPEGAEGRELEEGGAFAAWGAAARGALSQLPPYHLRLLGAAPVRSGVVACGYPPTDYAPVRAALRAAAPCREPHAQDIHHVTLLRWTAPLTPEENNAVRAVLAHWRRAELGAFQPAAWSVGYATWSVRPETVRPVVTWRAPPSPWVLHRGNTAGLAPATENHPPRLWALLREGWDVEVDLWRATGAEAVALCEAATAAGHGAGPEALAALRAHVAGAPGRAARAALWLGHDAPTHPLEPEEERDGGLLSARGVWIHCKNVAALAHLRAHPRAAAFNFFAHDKDDVALTSRGWAWGYPGKEVPGAGTVSVVWPKEKRHVVKPGVGVCWDWLPGDVELVHEEAPPQLRQ